MINIFTKGNIRKDPLFIKIFKIFPLQLGSYLSTRIIKLFFMNIFKKKKRKGKKKKNTFL